MMLIRPATPDDAPAITHVHVQSWLTTYRGIVPDAHLDSLVSSQSQRTERHREKIAAGTTIQLVAANHLGEIVGWVSAGAARDDDFRNRGYTGEVYAIYLLQTVQRQGIGRALVAEVFRRLRDQKHTRGLVCVLRENTSAVAFYQSLGAAHHSEITLEIGGRACPALILVFESLHIAPRL